MTKIASATRREEFDREREFVVFKPLTLGGKLLTRGQHFDKTKVNVRRLRQLYDNFDIIHANGTERTERNVKPYHRSEPPRHASNLEDDLNQYTQEHTEHLNGKARQEVSKETTRSQDTFGSYSEAKEEQEGAQVIDKQKIERVKTSIPRVGRN